MEADGFRVVMRDLGTTGFTRGPEQIDHYQ
jgi:hypothetical protein